MTWQTGSDEGYLFHVFKESFKYLQAKLLYRSLAGRHFYGTENEIWAGFGLVGNTEKNWGPIMGNF